MPTLTPPLLSLFFESAENVPPVKLGQWQFQDYSIGLDSTEKVLHHESFGILRIVIQYWEANNIHLLIDGKYAPLTIYGNSLVARIPLFFDIEFHRIALLARPQLALTVDVAVEHLYAIKGNSFAVPLRIAKWSRNTYETELTRLCPIFARRSQAGVLEDSSARGVTIAPDENLSEALLQICGRLSMRIETAQLDEMRADFQLPGEGEIDKEGLMSLIKEDFRRLVKSPKGPITLNGERYSTTLNVRHSIISNLVDLSSLYNAIQTTEALLRKSSCPVAIVGMLADILMSVEHYCQPGRRDVQDIGFFLEKPMKSAFGLDVQSFSRHLVLLATKQIGRDSRNNGIFWLRRAVRDFDVFEAAAFASCASALGFTDSEILGCTTGILQRDGVTIGDANTKRGLEIFRKAVRGWRAPSTQPSNYRPDSFVLLDGARPILIDAKFRIATSGNMLASPDGLKDVQAYLDDFGMNAAIVVVPRIVNTSLCVSTGLGVIQSTDSHGRHRIIAIVELQSSDDPLSIANLKKAVELVAAANVR